MSSSSRNNNNSNIGEEIASGLLDREVNFDIAELTPLRGFTQRRSRGGFGNP